jgi:hypothetical protein
MSSLPVVSTMTQPAPNPTRAVVYAMLLSVMFIFLGGSPGIRKLRNGINATVGRPTVAAEKDTGTVLSAQVFTGWAILLVMLVALTDNDTTAPLGVGFAYLLLLSIIMLVGPDAFNNISSLGSQPPSSGGGGGKKKR